MDELKALIGMLNGLPNAVLWVLLGYLVYKLVVIGSIYGVIKFITSQLFDWLKIRKIPPPPPPVALDATINGMCITTEGVHLSLVTLLNGLRGIHLGERGASAYIHKRDVEWLREAIEMKLAADKVSKAK